MTSVKRDTHAIWFSHLPDMLVDVLTSLAPNSSQRLYINGQATCWARMRPSGHKPTPGIKIISGIAAWERIGLGQTFELSLRETGVYSPSSAPMRLRALPERSAKRLPLFQGYAFADFSGARDKALQRRTIKFALATENGAIRPYGRSLTRESLQAATLRELEEATREGRRLALGRDHQFSIPIALAMELGLPLQYRNALNALVRGTYGGPSLAHPQGFARAFNEWLQHRELRPYFYSCTKAAQYGIPSADPRPGMQQSTYRLTERIQPLHARTLPKPFNRIGDNGTVGGQTLVGLMLIHELLSECQHRSIPVAVWPMDGLDICSAAYEGRHVLLEPYPTAVRPVDMVQSDWNDAYAAAYYVQRADQEGRLAEVLDLSMLDENAGAQVLFEGWIVGHRASAVH